MATSKRIKPAASAFKHAYAIIMAGGSGTRFWPVSRRKRPKQLLDLFGRSTLLEQAVARVRPVIPEDRIYIFTSDLVRNQIVRLLPKIPKRQIVAEPAQRNTAPTIGLAAHEILRRDPEGIMVILPADHVIEKAEAFRDALAAGCEWAAEEGRSVVLGIKPDHPETGYGYVRLGAPAKKINGQRVYSVERFVEKPDLPAAKRYVASGRYLWNAGMFIWRASTLIENLRRLQPGMAAGLDRIAEAGGIGNTRGLNRSFPRLDKISIDYALMEKLTGVFAISADIGWSDVGSWAVAYQLSEKNGDGNVQPRESLSISSKRNMVVSDRGVVVTIGVQDLIVVRSGDALLICHRDSSQQVGKAVQELERMNFSELL